MLDLGFLAFTQASALFALIALPLIWLLLRITPPAPRRLRFPAVSLLLGLRPKEETPARTPWWLLLLRLLIAALIILALARPVLNPEESFAGSRSLVLLVDNGWAAAKEWSLRENTLIELLDQAGREDMRVVLVPTAPAASPDGEQPPVPQSATAARGKIKGLEPQPWPVDRQKAVERLEATDLPDPSHILWLSDGIAGAGDREVAERLQGLGRLTVLRPEPDRLPTVLLAPGEEAGNLILRARRPAGEGSRTVSVTATGEDGRFVARRPLEFAEGAEEAETRLDLPPEMRNRITELRLDGESSANAVVLVDERWRRRPVGLIAQENRGVPQPLLNAIYYLEKALGPFTEIRAQPVDTLMRQQHAMLVKPDGAIPDGDVAGLADWVEAGGVLLRFAGPRLVESDDQLLPVVLRGSDRILGGALTWDTPARIADFPPGSPFEGLHVPEDVRIKRQVLAEPSIDLADKTWARLEDGTPLVTAEKRGKGWLVLIHLTAETSWSNLPLSGLFVEMLQRVLSMSHGINAPSEGGQELQPNKVVDGFGQLGDPAPSVRPLSVAQGETPALDRLHPPGLYGADGRIFAHNLGTAIAPPSPLSNLPENAVVRDYGRSAELELKPWLLLAALALFLADLVIGLGLRGLLPARAYGAVALLGAVLLLPNGPVRAQEAEEARALEATLVTHLAYVITRVPEVDRVSEAGLTGLTRVLDRRTAVEAGPPLGVDLRDDELAFFPLLYWPVTEGQEPLDQSSARRVMGFLRNGGTIFFDLRDPSGAERLQGQQSAASQTLRQLTRHVDIPPLEPVGPDHVLTRSFYLMQDFPGRYTGGTLWLDDRREAADDGIASVIVGSNDYAAAWAVDESGRPMLPVVPGQPMQRELAYRFGVNLVMYALTGNYKADQVHLPFILERLGQ